MNASDCGLRAMSASRSSREARKIAKAPKKSLCLEALNGVPMTCESSVLKRKPSGDLVSRIIRGDCT